MQATTQSETSRCSHGQRAAAHRESENEVPRHQDRQRTLTGDLERQVSLVLYSCYVDQSFHLYAPPRMRSSFSRSQMFCRSMALNLGSVIAGFRW